MDHAAGFAYYLSHRNFCGQSTGTILAPEGLIGPMKKIIDAWGRLDGNTVPANLVGVKAGDEYQIKPNLYARVFPTKHSRGSVGYSLIEKRKKLKPEYSKLTGPQLVELKKQGITIDYPVEIPIVSYLGDTQYVDFSSLDYVAKSRILIAECTFYIDDHVERAAAGKHLHLNEFAKLIEKMDNEHVIIMHTTQRTPLRDIRKMLKNALPAKSHEKVILLMDKRFQQHK
jgi:ribonuclease Z